MENLIGKHVCIKGRDKTDPNHEGHVDDQKGNIVYVTNLNMPYCGTMIMEPFNIKDIIRNYCPGEYDFFARIHAMANTTFHSILK